MYEAKEMKGSCPLIRRCIRPYTRDWLTESVPGPGVDRPTQDDIPDAELDRVAALGFDWVWLLSVWQTGRPRSGSRAPIRVATEFEETLPDLREEDIAGSGFAITGYTVHRTWAAMRRWRACGSACGAAGCG
jgi:hypothetical protein